MAVTFSARAQIGAPTAKRRRFDLDWRTARLLGALLALGLALRLWGLTWGLPWAFHPDEIYYVDKAEEMVRTGDLDPRYFQNPTLFTYLVAVELVVIRALGPLAGPLATGSSGATNLVARLDSALL